MSTPQPMPSERMFLCASLLLFVAATVTTFAWCGSMSAMPGMTMPGGWTMSMTWMRMPGQGWPGTAASFVGMWTVMMAAMMLPSLVPMLRRYRHAVASGGCCRLGALTTMAGVGYLLVWCLAGLAIFPPGMALAAAAMHWPALSRALPIAGAVVVMLAGALQFTRWKLHRLECCRAAPPRGHVNPPTLRRAWRHGMHLGLHCCRCCANLAAVLLVIGVMDLPAMIFVTATITAERLAGARLARLAGVVIVLAGLLMLVRATGTA